MLLHLPFFPCERETEKPFTAHHHSDISIAALRRVPGVELYSLCTHGPARLLLVCPWQAKLALYVGSQQARSNMCEAIGGLSYGLNAGDYVSYTRRRSSHLNPPRTPNSPFSINPTGTWRPLCLLSSSPFRALAPYLPACHATCHLLNLKSGKALWIVCESARAGRGGARTRRRSSLSLSHASRAELLSLSREAEQQSSLCCLSLGIYSLSL